MGTVKNLCYHPKDSVTKKCYPLGVHTILIIWYVTTEEISQRETNLAK